MRCKIVRFQKLVWRNMMRSTKSQKVSVLHYSIDLFRLNMVGLIIHLVFNICSMFQNGPFILDVSFESSTFTPSFKMVHIYIFKCFILVLNIYSIFQMAYIL